MMVTNREFIGMSHHVLSVRGMTVIIFLVCILSPGSTEAQNEQTGAFEGRIVNSETGEPIAGGTVLFTNEASGISLPIRHTDSQGFFYQGLLPPGKYTITMSAPGFKTRQESRRLAATMINQIIPLPVPLDPESASSIDLTTSGQTFVGKWEAFNLWEAPSNWQPLPGRLLVNERGVALPRDKSYRSYSDFSLISDVKMLNGVAASFVIHAIDTRNYYLIQLTGPQADQPYVLRSFIVKNGVSQPWKSVPIDIYAATLLPGKFFQVSMKMTGNILDVSVTDSETGTELRLGTLSDPNLTFRVGAVGLAVRDNEQNEIGRFIVSLF